MKIELREQALALTVARIMAVPKLAALGVISIKGQLVFVFCVPTSVLACPPFWFCTVCVSVVCDTLPLHQRMLLFSSWCIMLPCWSSDAVWYEILSQIASITCCSVMLNVWSWKLFDFRVLFVRSPGFWSVTVFALLWMWFGFRNCLLRVVVPCWMSALVCLSFWHHAHGVADWLLHVWSCKRFFVIPPFGDLVVRLCFCSVSLACLRCSLVLKSCRKRWDLLLLRNVECLIVEAVCFSIFFVFSKNVGTACFVTQSSRILLLLRIVQSLVVEACLVCARGHLSEFKEQDAFLLRFRNCSALVCCCCFWSPLYPRSETICIPSVFEPSHWHVSPVAT